MADKPLPWFRLYSEIISDRKIAIIARLSDLSKVEIIGIFTVLLCLASESPDRGKLLVTQDVPYSIDDIADEIGIDFQITQSLLEIFETLEMIQFTDGAYSIRNWGKRQYKSDDSSERVTRFRENQKRNVGVTLQKGYSNGSVTPPETESDTETERDREAQASADHPSNWIIENLPKPEQDPFDTMQRMVETLTGYPIPTNVQEIKAINEFIALGVIEADIRDALAFLSGAGKVARGASGLAGSVKVACVKRTQKSNGRKAAPAFVPEDHASEVY